MTNKADQDYWNGHYRTIEHFAAAADDPVRQWIEAHVPAAERKGESSCLEVGCFPGTYLSVFGERGYRLYGVDFAEKLESMAGALTKAGFEIGEFWREDFLTFDPKRRFDVVASFGFIEHFTDWEQIVDRHAELVAPGGWIVAEAPNFFGAAQHWIHSRFDAANLARHHAPAMDVEAWARRWESQGFEIAASGFFGPFDFWVHEDDPRSVAQRAALKGLKALRRPLGAILPKNAKAFAPRGGVVARKHAAD